VYDKDYDYTKDVKDDNKNGNWGGWVKRAILNEKIENINSKPIYISISKIQ
jgi:hypothetical protein